MGKLSKQENSAGRPSSQSQLPRFESFRYIVPNVFVDDEPQANAGILPVNFESFNHHEEEIIKKKKPSKKSMFNVKNNRQLNNLRQKVIERNFRGGFNTINKPGNKEYKSTKREKPKKRKIRIEEKRQSINGRMGTIYAENIRQSLEDIEKGIGEVVKKISVYSKKKVPKFEKNRNMHKTRNIEIKNIQTNENVKKKSNRTSLANENRPKKTKKNAKKRKSISRSTRKKMNDAIPSSYKHSKKNSNLFSEFSSSGKTFAMFSSSLKNSLVQNERRQSTADKLKQGLISLKNSGVFNKKPGFKKKIKNANISLSATRGNIYEQSPMRKKNTKKSRDHSLKKIRKTKSIRSSNKGIKNPRKSISKSLKKKQNKNGNSSRGKKKKNKTLKSLNLSKHLIQTADNSSTIKKLKSRRKSKNRSMKFENELSSLFKKKKKPMEIKSFNQSKITKSKTSVNKHALNSPFSFISDDSSEESLNLTESEVIHTSKKRRSSYMDPNFSINNKEIEMFKKRKSLFENQKNQKQINSNRPQKIYHKKTQSQVDLRKKKEKRGKSNNKIASKSPKKIKTSMLSKTYTQNKYNSKISKNSLHSLLYKKLKTSNLTSGAKKNGINSDRSGISKSNLYENKSYSGVAKIKKFYTNKRDNKKKTISFRSKLEGESKGYKNLYQKKKEGHARLRKATQKQFAKYFGTNKD